MFEPLIARINTDVFERRRAFNCILRLSTKEVAWESAAIREIRVIRGSQVFDVAL
jgi:hypothetical protein